MAENKILNTRVQLKYDLYSEWQKVESTFKPLKGEICIVNPGTKLSDATAVPCLMKVGDGDNFFKDLPWVSALAADVYEWAKKPDPDWKDFPALPIEVKDEGTGKFVTDITYSDNTITISRADVVWGDIAGEIPDTKLPEIPLEKLPEIPADKIVQSKDYGKVTANTGSVEADEVHDEFAIKGEGVISTSAANGTITIKADLANYKTKQTAVQDPTATGSATAFITSISQDTNGKITVAKSNITAEALGLASAMHFIGVSTTDPSKGTVTIENKVHTPANGDVVLYSGKEYVYGNNKWNELGDEGSHALKSVTITGTDGLTGGGDLSQNRTISLSDATKTSLEKADNAKQIQTAVANKITDKAHVLTSLTQNANGDISYAVKVLTPADIGAQPAGDYKTKQNAVNDPTASGSALSFIDTISQDTNGKISATKKNVDLSNYALKTELPTVNDGTFTVSGKGALSGSGSMSANQAGNSAAELDVKAGGIDTARLADKTVTTAKIDDKAVTTAKIDDKAVTTAKIADHAVVAHHTKACADYASNSDAEVWVFHCGSSTVLVDNTGLV